MFHTVAKIAGFFIQPSSFIVALMGIGVLCLVHPSWRRAGRRLFVFSFVLLLGGFLPLGTWLLLPLEDRFAAMRLPSSGDDVEGVIILGGFEEGGISAARPGLAVNESAERLMEGMRLAQRWPMAKVVFTGSTAGGSTRGHEAADAVGAFLRQAGIAPHRIVVEPRARNTYQNAVFTRELVKPRAGQTWVLVTSAFHMPRAMGAFRQAGFSVVPAVVDYRTRGASDSYFLHTSLPRGLHLLDIAVLEWVGLAVYRLTGRSNKFFPAP